MSMLNYDYESSYTPDYTANLLNFVNLTGTQFLSEKLLLSGNVYYRHLITDSVNGNINDSYLDARLRWSADRLYVHRARACRTRLLHAGAECDLAARAKHQGHRPAADRFPGPVRLERTRLSSARTSLTRTTRSSRRTSTAG